MRSNIWVRAFIVVLLSLVTAGSCLARQSVLSAASTASAVPTKETGLASWLTIIYPNGGERFLAGSKFTALWMSSGFQPTDKLAFDLVRSTGEVYPLTASTFNSGSESFVIPKNVNPGQYKLSGRFLASTISDLSNNSFSISPAIIGVSGVAVPLAQWVYEGAPGIGENPNIINVKNIAISHGGVPYTVFVDPSRENRLTVKKFGFFRDYRG